MNNENYLDYNFRDSRNERLYNDPHQKYQDFAARAEKMKLENEKFMENLKKLSESRREAKKF